MGEGDPRALLVTGTFGTGKTTLIEELAEMLEGLDLPYGAIDLDWLAWTNVHEQGLEHGIDDLEASNLEAVVANYLKAGARYFLLARAVKDREGLKRLRAALDMPLTVVRLALGIDEIKLRLSGSVTSGRKEDLRMAADWLVDEEAADIADATFVSDRPIQDLATEVLALLGWR